MTRPVSKPLPDKTHDQAGGKVTPDAKQPDSPAVLAPVEEKIGEPRGNLDSRAAAFRRRRGTT